MGMKPVCIRAVSEALGRDLTAAEAEGIGDRVNAGMRSLARKNLAKYQAMSEPEKLREGAKMAAFTIKQDAAEAKFRSDKQDRVHEENARLVADWKERGGTTQDFLERSLHNNADGRSTVQSLESKVTAVFSDYARRLKVTLEAAHPRMLGLISNLEGARLVTRELYGEDTGNAQAKAAAKEWTAVIDAAVAQFKSAGGALHRLASWSFPQHHDQMRVFKAGVDKWVAHVMPRLDRRKYVNENGRLMTDEEVEAGIREAWLSISSGGANDIEPGAGGGSRMEAKKYLDHRALHFKDAESWLTYQAEFGTGDLWHAMTTHLHGMSRSIALLEKFGPNAQKEWDFWQDTAVKETAGKTTDALAVRDHLDRAYRNLSGQTDGIAHAVVASIADNVKNILTASRLGSAIISSIPDLGTMWMTARYNRLSGLETYANSFKALGAEGKADLQRAGLMIESTLYSLQRFQNDALGPTYSARLAEFTMNAQGLNKWTGAGRGGFSATQMHGLAEITRGVKKLDDLPPEDARLLRGNGVTDTDVALWAAAKPYRSRKFGEILTPDDIYAIPDDVIVRIMDEQPKPAPKPEAAPTHDPRTGEMFTGEGAVLGEVPPPDVPAPARTPMELRREAAQKLLGLTISESHMAIVEPGAAQRLQTGAGAAKGSAKSVLAGAFWQFKSFPWALFQKHFVQRAGVFGGGAFDTAGGKAKYIAGSTIAATLLGALSLEIGDMLMGKDPRPLWGSDPKVVMRNWAAAFLKGGALGIYGDFLATEVSPGFTSPIATLLGPTGGLIHDVAGLTVGNVVQAGSGKDTNAGAEAVRLLKGITPGSSLWYGKAALDHLIFNQLTDAMNPDHLRRAKQRAQKEFGTTYFWPPTDVLPARPPDITRAVGGRQ